MTEDIAQWFNLDTVLFYVCIAGFLLVAVLSLVAYHLATRGARIRELVLIWMVAVGGSMVGSMIIAILGYILTTIDSASTTDWNVELLGAAIGMLFSIPIGIVAGGLAGTMLAAILVLINSWRPTLIASVGAVVVATLVSGVVLVPIGFFIFAIAHI